MVGFRELKQNQKAKDSVHVEMGKLRKRGVWNEKKVREKEDVEIEAQEKQIDTHFAKLLVTCTQKNIELKVEEMMKYKGRVCLDGRAEKVRDQWGLRAVFQHLTSLPASMPANRAGMAYGDIQGHYTETADANQAYTQSPYSGVPTWVEMDEEFWPPEWKGKYVNPVVRLVRALYGHPDAGGP